MNQELIQQFRLARADDRLVVLEGFHSVKHALRFEGELTRIVVVDRDEIMKLASNLAPDVKERLGRALAVVTRLEFEQLSPSPHPTGIIAIARRPVYDLRSILSDQRTKPVVLLEDPRNLGNLGAAIRVSSAAGAAGLIALGEASPWNSQAVRGGAGLQFALPVVKASELPESDRPVVVIHPEVPNLELGEIPSRAILAFGTERAGLSQLMLRRAHYRVRIPMEPGVSSLNLATAVAIVLYAGKRSN